MIRVMLAALAFAALSLPAVAQEPTRQQRATALIAASSWGEPQVTEYIRLVHTQEGRSVLLPATSARAECDRQVAALTNLQRRLQTQPAIAEALTEYRIAGMRQHATQLRACNGVIAQLDRLAVARRALAASASTQGASARATCDASNWRWDSPLCASPNANSIGSYVAFFNDPRTTHCQMSIVWHLSKASGWHDGVMMARHYIDMRFDGRVLDEAACRRSNSGTQSKKS